MTHLRHVFKYMFIWKTFSYSYLIYIFFSLLIKRKKKYKKIKSNNNNNKNQMIESTCFVYKNNFLGQRRRLWFYLFPHVHILLLERVFSVAGKPLVIPFMFVDTLFVLDMYICVYVHVYYTGYICYLGSSNCVYPRLII